jgi:hypothetical protein
LALEGSTVLVKVRLFQLIADLERQDRYNPIGTYRLR